MARLWVLCPRCKSSYSLPCAPRRLSEYPVASVRGDDCPVCFEQESVRTHALLIIGHSQT
jgi:hypothetical protein